jgi:hypothetical protein
VAFLAWCLGNDGFSALMLQRKCLFLGMYCIQWLVEAQGDSEYPAGNTNSNNFYEIWSFICVE